MLKEGHKSFDNWYLIQIKFFKTLNSHIDYDTPELRNDVKF